jgi:hypothetical protein
MRVKSKTQIANAHPALVFASLAQLQKAKTVPEP